MATQRADKGGKKEQNFENALSRLEKIVEEMESGTLNLDRLMSHFEEGTQLVKFCTAKLNEVEHKIEKLVKKGDDMLTEPLEIREED